MLYFCTKLFEYINCNMKRIGKICFMTNHILSTVFNSVNRLWSSSIILKVKVMNYTFFKHLHWQEVLLYNPLEMVFLKSLA